MQTLAVDALCDRLGGDTLLGIAVDNPLGGGSYCEWGVAYLGKQIEQMGGEVRYILNHEQLAAEWCRLRGYKFVRVTQLSRDRLA